MGTPTASKNGVTNAAVNLPSLEISIPDVTINGLTEYLTTFTPMPQGLDGDGFGLWLVRHLWVWAVASH